MYQTTLSISDDLLDPEYQHIHHADALKLLEKGRLHFLNEIGIPQEELLQNDCFLVLSRCDVRFLRELKGEDVVCTVEVKSIDSDSSFVLKQQLIKAPKRVAVEGEIALVAMSGAKRRKIPLPENLLKALQKYSR